ncbi:MAG: peptidase [Thaumarchaeota archaeon]|nr:peptidase [Nitrososphaerota archaeon]MBI3642190.1 peptidase [Nitrososphaerota archaeon]
MLLIASFYDVWKREVNDALWIAFGIVSIVLIFFEPELLVALKGVGISLIIAPIALIIWRAGIFGGADAFGLIVLAALAPHATLSQSQITPFTTLTNAAILSTAPIFFNLIRNLIAISKHQNIFLGFEETKRNKIIAMFLGYRAKNPKYSFSIEKSEGNHKKLDFSFRNAEQSEFNNGSDVWVTPGIPYMIYITAGFVVQIIFGDIIFHILHIQIS